MIELRVGQPNPRLDALLAREGLETAACVHAQKGLDEVLQEEGYAGSGAGSVLVVAWNGVRFAPQTDVLVTLISAPFASRAVCAST